MLWVALAGGVRVEVAGVAVDDRCLGGRQGRRLLARLAWEGRAVHRDELADGIWPGVLPRTWERTLSGVITRLRTGLSEAGAGRDVISFIDGRYRLLGDGDVHVDVRDAGYDLVAARGAADGGHLERAREMAEGVLKVARVPLLPGEDAGWVDLARARHRALLLDALDVMVDIGLGAGWYVLAEDAAREAVYWDPLREAGHQRLLQSLAAKGDRAAVLTAYETCRQLLAAELGVNPSSDTEVIYREVLGVEPEVVTVPDARPSTAPTIRAPFPATLAKHVTTLVGREAALVWLWSLWRRARVQAPLTVVLHGPAGAGKRSLAAVFAADAYASGSRVVHRSISSVDHTLDQPARGARSSSLLAVVEWSVDVGDIPAVDGAALILVVSEMCPPDSRGDAALTVTPLDRDSVAAMAEGRLGRPLSEAELDELCGTSGGWPGAVAATISGWADDRARILAREAATANASLLSAHSDLAEEILRRPRPLLLSAASSGHAPYKGLLRFEPEDAPLFFGREQLVADVLARLSADRLVVVLGASGSGKSSMVRAGVVAELRRGALPGSDGWPVVLLTPGRDPLTSLTSCLVAATQASVGASLDVLVDDLDRISPSVVVVDQFEELFMVATSERERVTFIDALLRGLAADVGHRVVLVLRSDFYDACTALPGLSAVITGTPVVVSPPSELELRRIVSLPARAAGGMLEAGLIDEVIADTRAAPGALPLVSTAMLESWGRRDGSTLTVESYRAAGGVAGAIATLAENVWTGLKPTEQRRARAMLLRLSGEDGDVNNPVRRSELLSTADATAGRVLDRLVHRRLVTIDDDTVRLAHEALLREWPRFRGWLAEDRVLRDGLHHLRRAATEWERRGRDVGDLYRGTRLAAAVDLPADVELCGAERSFVDASVHLQRTELHGLKRRSRRLRALSAVLVVLLVVAAYASVIAVSRRREASDQARLATAQLLAREAESADGLALRLLLAVEARRLDDSPEARGALLDQLTRSGAVTGFVRGGADNLSAVSVSPDGRLLATAGTNGTVSVWRLPKVEPVATVVLLDGRVAALGFSSDGELAAGGEDGEVARWTPGDSDPVRFDAHTQAVLAVAYRRDGALVTAGRDGLLRSFSVATGKELWSTSVPGGGVAGSFDRNGTRYAQIAGDAELTMIDVDASGGHIVVETITAPSINEPTALALSADGRILAIGDRSGGVHVFEPDSGDAADLGRVSVADDAEGSAAGVEKLLFTGSGEVLATAGGAIGRFRIGGPNPAGGTVQVVGGRVTGLAADPAGVNAVAVTETGETILLELDRSNLGRPLSNAGQPVSAFSVGADGTIAAMGDGQLAVLNALTGERRVVSGPVPPVTAVSNSGGLLAIGERIVPGVTFGGGSHAVVDLASGERVVERAWLFAVTAIALQPGGELLAIGDEHGQVQLVDANTARRGHDLPSLPAATAALAFTAAGDELVGLAADGTMVRWDSQGRPIGERIELGVPATALTIAADGRTVAVATADGAVIVDLASRRVRPSLTSPFGRVESVSFGLDGTVVATGGSGRVLLWDVASGRRLGEPLPAPGNTAIAFDQTGRRLITGDLDGEVVVWEMDPDRWVEMACDIAGRTLSRDEWRHYLGSRAYHPACQ